MDLLQRRIVPGDMFKDVKGADHVEFLNIWYVTRIHLQQDCTGQPCLRVTQCFMMQVGADQAQPGVGGGNACEHKTGPAADLK